MRGRTIIYYLLRSRPGRKTGKGVSQCEINGPEIPKKTQTGTATVMRLQWRFMQQILVASSRNPRGWARDGWLRRRLGLGTSSPSPVARPPSITLHQPFIKSAVINPASQKPLSPTAHPFFFFLFLSLPSGLRTPDWEFRHLQLTATSTRQTSATLQLSPRGSELRR